MLHYASLHALSLQIENFDQLFLENFWKGYDAQYNLEKTERVKISKFVLYRDLMVYAVLHKLYPSEAINKPIRLYFDRLNASIEKRRRALNLRVY